MRTTVTLDPDVDVALRKVAGEFGISLEQALNVLVRLGLLHTSGLERPYRVPRRSLGLQEGVDLDKALRLASELEDAELVRKLEPRQ